MLMWTVLFPHMKKTSDERVLKVFIQKKTLEIAILIWRDENKNFPWFKRDKRTYNQKKAKCFGDEQNKTDQHQMPQRKSLLSRDNKCSPKCCHRSFSLGLFVGVPFFCGRKYSAWRGKNFNKEWTTKLMNNPENLWREKKGMRLAAPFECLINTCNAFQS